MLILTDADRLGVDLHEFGKRILEPPGDRHRAAVAHIHIREFLRREFARGVDAGTRLAHNSLRKPEFRMAMNQVIHEFHCFAGRRPVSDTDQ